MKIIIIHGKTLDGLMCREIALRYFKHAHPDAIINFQEWSPGDPLPDVSNPDSIPHFYIHLLGVSIHELMTHPNLIWIDNNVSAIRTYKHAIRGHRMIGVAVCRLAYQWFHIGEPATVNQGLLDFTEHKAYEPPVIRLIGEYIVQ